MKIEGRSRKQMFSAFSFGVKMLKKVRYERNVEKSWNFVKDVVFLDAFFI